MKFLGIDFAPLRGIPLVRRIQTFAILYFACEFFFLPILYTVLLVFLLFTKFYYLTIIYLIHWYFDFRTPVEGGNPLKFVKEFKFWSYMCDYFSLKAIKTCELDPNRNYLFAIHPHGVTSCGTVLGISYAGSDFYNKFPNLKIKFATLNGQFIFPIHRDLLLALGFCSATKASLKYLFERKENVALVVGGALEALSTKSNPTRLNLKKRKGFIKLAVEHGTSLIPVFQFGENQIWHQTEFSEKSLMGKFQKFFTHYASFSPPIFHGRGVFNYTFGFIPFRKPLTIVVGKPIHIDKVENPSNELIEEIHSKYIKNLIELFEEYNPIYGVKGGSLEIY